MSQNIWKVLELGLGQTAENGARTPGLVALEDTGALLAVPSSSSSLDLVDLLARSCCL